MYEDRLKNRADKRVKTKDWLIKGSKIAGVALLVVAIFGLGLNVGNGTISISGSGSQNASLPSQLDYSSVDQAYNELKAKYDGKLDQNKLLDGLKQGMVSAAGDPYTVYLSAEEAESFNEQLTGTFSGIGAELGKDADGNLIIVTPIDDTPASRAGLRAQDIIVAIDGKATTTAMSVDEAVSKIRGKKGTKVELKIVRAKKDQLSFTITRDDITIPSVKSEILGGNIGYLRINRFGEDTAKLARSAADDFKNRGVEGVVLDLRGNPGGLVTAAVNVTSMWLPEGKTVLVEKRGSETVSSDLSNGIAPLLGVPTAVLIDEGSASAAEITAGALKDNRAATIFGVKSFGKGSVQQLVDLPGGDTLLKVTVARWYRPNGQNIDKKGITPDHEIKMSEDDIKADKDPQKDAAIEFLKKY